MYFSLCKGEKEKIPITNRKDEKKNYKNEQHQSNIHLHTYFHCDHRMITKYYLIYKNKNGFLVAY